MRDRRRAAATILAALASLFGACVARSEGPQTIAWDREPCGHCRMLVGEKQYAAQAIGLDGRAVSFDDPGCLFTWLDQGGEAKTIWLHHLGEERWLRAPSVAFVETERSPMGYRLGAVDPGTAGALGWDDARRQVAASRSR